MQLGADCDRFPSPKMLLDRLPKRKVLALPAPEPKEITPERQAVIDERWRILKEQMKCISKKTHVKPLYRKSI